MRSLTCYVIFVYFLSAVSALRPDMLNDAEFELVEKAKFACFKQDGFSINGEVFSGNRLRFPDYPYSTKAEAEKICPKIKSKKCFTTVKRCEDLWGSIDGKWTYNIFVHTSSIKVEGNEFVLWWREDQYPAWTPRCSDFTILSWLFRDALFSIFGVVSFFRGSFERCGWRGRVVQFDGVRVRSSLVFLHCWFVSNLKPCRTFRRLPHPCRHHGRLI